VEVEKWCLDCGLGSNLCSFQLVKIKPNGEAPYVEAPYVEMSFTEHKQCECR